MAQVESGGMGDRGEGQGMFDPIADAKRIFDNAILEHDPRCIFLLTSGGNDSVVPLHLFRDHPRVTAAVHIDTGIKVDAVEPHVHAICEAFGLPLLIYRALENTKADGTPDPMDYDAIVAKYGFPGPAQHWRMYGMLKERQVRRLIRDHKEEFKDRIMLVTGVRRSESMRRMGTVEEVNRQGAAVWVAPVTNWSTGDMRAYRAKYKLPESDVSRRLGMSGECLCGAFAREGELAVLREHYPETAARIERLQAGKPWGWEGKPRKGLDEERIEEPYPLCEDCGKQHRIFPRED